MLVASDFLQLQWIHKEVDKQSPRFMTVLNPQHQASILSIQNKLPRVKYPLPRAGQCFHGLFLLT